MYPGYLQPGPVPSTSYSPPPAIEKLPSFGSGHNTQSIINVKLLDQYRLSPPVVIPPSLVPSDPSIGGSIGTGNVNVSGIGASGGGGGGGGRVSGGAGSSALQDMELERQLVESIGQSHAETFFKAAEPGSAEDPRMKKYISMGYERTEVAIGLAYVQQAKLSDSEVVEFVKNLRELRSMGYGLPLAVGALVRSKNSLPAATEEVLNSS